MIFQDVQADRSVAVHVGVVDFGDEGYFGRFEGVIGWELDAEIEDASLILFVKQVLGR